MKNSNKLKPALLAAVSFAAVTGFASHAAPARHNTPPAIEQLAVAADHADSERAAAPSAVKRIGLLAAAAGVLAALVRVIGVKKIANAVRAAGPVVAKAARAGVQAPLAAARYIAKSASAPLRFALAMGLLALIAFTGIGYFDVEWIGGIAVGIAMTALAWRGAGRVRRAFAPAVKAPRAAPVDE